MPRGQLPPEKPLGVSPLIHRALVLSLFGSVLVTAALMANLLPGQTSPIGDFQLFHMVGRMVWRGELLQAYSMASLLQAEVKIVGVMDFMPWTYPPPFDLVAALLACGPLGISYLLFMGLSLTSFLLVLQRIAGPSFPLVLVALYPALLMTISCGQNGFVTGTLVGLAALGLQRNRAIAGVPLGLMIIKPHLVGAFAVYGLMTGRWRMLVVAVATTGLASAIAGLLLGPAVWGAALAAAREAQLFLAAGLYPLYRMISVYAAVRSLGAPAWVAFAAQAVIALSGMVLLTLATRRSMPANRLLGLTCLATLFVSPYAYDYDLPIYGIALGFLMPDLVRLGRRGELVALLALSAAASGGGWVSTFWLQLTNPALLERVMTPGVDTLTPSVAGLIMLGIVTLIARVLTRDRGHPVDATAPGGPRIAEPRNLPLGNASSAVVL